MFRFPEEGPFFFNVWFNQESIPVAISKVFHNGQEKDIQQFRRGPPTWKSTVELRLEGYWLRLPYDPGSRSKKIKLQNPHNGQAIEGEISFILQSLQNEVLWAPSFTFVKPRWKRLLHLARSVPPTLLFPKEFQTFTFLPLSKRNRWCLGISKLCLTIINSAHLATLEGSPGKSRFVLSTAEESREKWLIFGEQWILSDVPQAVKNQFPGCTRFTMVQCCDLKKISHVVTSREPDYLNFEGLKGIYFLLDTKQVIVKTCMINECYIDVALLRSNHWQWKEAVNVETVTFLLVSKEPENFSEGKVTLVHPVNKSELEGHLTRVTDKEFRFRYHRRVLDTDYMENYQQSLPLPSQQKKVHVREPTENHKFIMIQMKHNPLSVIFPTRLFSNFFDPLVIKRIQRVFEFPMRSKNGIKLDGCKKDVMKISLSGTDVRVMGKTYTIDSLPLKICQEKQRLFGDAKELKNMQVVVLSQVTNHKRFRKSRRQLRKEKGKIQIDKFKKATVN